MHKGQHARSRGQLSIAKHLKRTRKEEIAGKKCDCGKTEDSTALSSTDSEETKTLAGKEAEKIFVSR
jgi:hypothetical protein